MKIFIRGETIWADKKRYVGEYLDDKKHGHGTFEWGNGKKYEGEWINGKQNGRGKIKLIILLLIFLLIGAIILVQGERKEGIWEDGKRIKWIPEE